ncbi:hypothetical protein CG018_07575 [Gemella sp. ND 6198]|uniref:hypothetical protein n=1 Tax=Gemella sp. ND 6198 TaxID=2040624 RepID=UPI000E0BB79B|nr:hypothetical protein [Gemella sp. ND 6198]AXI27271.1 hypothetical protein CG018_07575 [Gemella sp. ND 6198]
MKNKLNKIVDELVLQENAWVSYWDEKNPNNITDCYSVNELKRYIDNIENEEVDGIVFQVNHEDDEEDYQFTVDFYERVIGGNQFILDLLHGI